MGEVVFVKLGGSLITDKRRPRGARREVLGRLAGEVAAAAAARPGGLVLGHGSGSFGHQEAARAGVHLGAGAPERLDGIAATQDAAATLHRLVVEALLAAGARPWSWAPSSALIAAAGKPVDLLVEPLARALDLGLLPVVYGDVVLDRERGCSICSTETLFLALIGGLAARGTEVRQVLWLGETDGVYDERGETIREITAGGAAGILERLSGAAGTDVTGGIRHRLESALELARRGIASTILDGRREGVLGRALAGEQVGGTSVRVG